MPVTRRSLAKLLAGAAVVQLPGTAQALGAQSSPADADMESAHALLKSNIEKIAKVKLPMATEPACHFKA